MSNTKIFLIISLSFLTGCSLFGCSSSYRSDYGVTHAQLPKDTRTFNDDFEHVWATVIMALGNMPLDKIDKEKGIIKTGWVQGYSQTRKARSAITDRFLEDYWKERYKLTITISGNIMASSVTVRCQLQQKPRGGSAAYRWERVKSTGEIEEEVLRRTEELLEEG
ncbi:MAG: DUF3576 domain-containing protein [Candidatus Scalindua rubra]|uniref:DUF3576 domain-containing protein n=1 Tax=Candidatus Scalindua brodae TaxID=237368 RepID=A0A0B0EDN5_9BACT|nr:MAG: hypothetical protein SCABRO_04039 [Candidatus Scalindua brodae]MBZ0109527.1 DUF3576 domain-containing protein [Candidatus Scalindua rubra]TWU33463.1 hypothetical protein S225a_13500 [Candidatus Brocadiaceae bacterium S225]